MARYVWLDMLPNCRKASEKKRSQCELRCLQSQYIGMHSLFDAVKIILLFDVTLKR